MSPIRAQRGDPAGSYADAFSVTIRTATSTNFMVTVVRVDAALGWGQTIRINWMAWE